MLPVKGYRTMSMYASDASACCGWATAGEGCQTGQHYLALQFGCECELRSGCSKAVPVETLCSSSLPIELALLRNVKN